MTARQMGRFGWTWRVLTAAAVLVPIVVSGARPATAAPAAAPRATGGSGFTAKDSLVAIIVDPAAGVPALGATAVAHLRIAAASGVATVRTAMTASGTARLPGASSSSFAIAQAGRQVTLAVPFTVAAAGTGVVDAEVTGLDSKGNVVATRLTHLWVEGFRDGIAQSANGPSDARVLRLQRLRAAGSLSDAQYLAAVEAAVGTGIADTGGASAGPTATGAPAAAPAGTTSTVTGHAKYTDSAGTTHPIRRAVVQLRALKAGGSDLLASGTTDDTGAYSLSGDSGGRDLVVRANSQSDGFAVQTTTGLIYFVQSPAKPPAAAVTVDTTSAVDDATHDTNGALNVADAMVTGVDYTKRLRGAKFPDIKVQFPDGSGTNFGGTVGHILRSDRYDWDVNLHEYGHFFADQSGIQDSTLTGDVSHSFGDNLATRYDKAKGEPLAWREGVATYFSLTAQQAMGTAAFNIPHVGDTHYSDLEEGAGNLDVDIETQAGGASLGEDNELSVMRTLWDIYDGHADTGDDRGVAFGDQAVYDTLKGAAAKTMSAGYTALVAGKPNRQIADIGCITTEHLIAPKITAPADKSIAKVATPPTFTWTKAGDGAGLPNDKFTVQFFDSTFGGPLFESPEQGGTSFTPTMAQWKTVLDGAGALVNVVVKGRQSAAPATGPYTSCNIRLVPEKLDLVFAIDTTGSMGPYINGVVNVANSVVDTLSGSGADFRVGVVDYKDVDSTFPGCPPDYDAVTDLGFSKDKAAITGALNGLRSKVAGGCDIPEDVLSGVKRAVDFPWRTGVKKAIIAMGDAPGHDPEAHSGLTSAAVIAAANAVDPAVIYPILVGFDGSATSFMTHLANGTGGKTFDSNASNVGQALLDAINAIVDAPIANAGGPYSGTVGTPITFDGSASISPTANIVKYEWDFNNDGTYDATSALPTISHSYTASYSGVVSLRVTDDGIPAQSAIATAAVTVTGGVVDTKTVVTSSANPSVFGQPVTLTATVAPVAGSAVPAGTVSLFDGSTAIGSGALIGSSPATFRVTTSSLAVGNHPITAHYSGASGFSPSDSAVLNQVVDKDASITSLTASPPGAQPFATPVTFTATVAAAPPGAGQPGGTVVFTVDGTPVGTVPVTAGQASLATSSLGPGDHVIAAHYSGDGHFSASATTLGHTTSCATTITGSHTGTVLANSASTCLVNSHVTGGVIVAHGASLAVENSTVDGSITATSGPNALRVCNSTVSGSFSVVNATGLVVIGDQGDANCAVNTIGGTLVLRTNTGGVEAIGNTVGGLVSSGNSGPGPYPGDVTTISGNR
jgi:hypothetical protein